LPYTGNMDSRERVLKTLKHEQPDRPPIFVTVTPQVAQALSEHLGIPYEPPIDSLLSTRISHMELLTQMGNDCIGIAACPPDSRPTTTGHDGIITNEWGMMFKPAGIYNEFHAYPLSEAESADDISNYPFFDPHDPGRFREAARAIEQYGKTHIVVGDLETSFFETSWYLVGMEKFLMDLVTGAPYVDPLMDKIMEINLETGKEMIRMGAEIIWAGDDFGTQRGMIMDPELWRAAFKPRIGEMFAEFRKVNPDIKIAWHSCGSILEIIPDFIEMGLDILNPLQPQAMGMDPQFLKSEYGKDLVFFGGIDVQGLLPYGSPAGIRKEVEKVCRILGRDGGYIVAPAHNIQPDTPVKNILALFEAVKSM
jgi:uroporphyrinogen decarboxylase